MWLLLRSRSNWHKAASLGFALAVLGCAPAGAHPFLSSSTPSAGETVAKSPESVRLDFNEEIEASFGAVRVYNDRGLRVERGIVTGERNVEASLIPALGAGTYVVHYRVAGRDGHPVSDAFVFHIGVATRPGAPPAARDLSGIARALFRWVALVALAVLLGSLLFLKDRSPRWPAAVAVASLVALLWADAVGLSGLPAARALAPEVVGQVVGTGAGAVRVVQFALALVALLAPRMLALAATVGALGAEAFAGHAASAPAPAISIGMQAIHIVAMGVWLGGLAILAFRREILTDYRKAALPAVGILIVTGTYNSFVEIQSLRQLTSTVYGRVLIAKLVLLAVVLALAWPRRRRIGIRRVWVELAGVAAIVGLAAVLSGIMPARSGAGPFSKVFELGDWRASLVVDPAQAGRNEIHLFLLSAPGRLATDVASARVSVQTSGGGIGPIDVNLSEEGAGHFVTETGVMTVTGEWIALVSVRRADGFSTNARIAFRLSP